MCEWDEGGVACAAACMQVCEWIHGAAGQWAEARHSLPTLPRLVPNLVLILALVMRARTHL